MIARSVRRLFGSAVIAAYLPAQRRIPYLPRARLDALRDRRIRAIVRYAARTVPFYREWFSRTGTDPRDIAGAADLARLPVIEKEDLRTRPAAFVAESAAARTGVPFATSGTTGTPATVRHDRRSLFANIAFGERERAPVMQACGGAFRPKELYVSYTMSTFKKVQAFYDENLHLPVRPLRSFVSVLEPIETIARIANEERPDVLVGYGAWIALFFRTIAARGIALHPLKLVMYMGEALPDGARELIEHEFGVPVLSRYNAVEAFKIGFFCERRTGFHLHEDLCHIRVVRADGETVAPGETGELLLSNLVNRATVLLNYRIGDLGTMSTERCPCGRSLAVLSQLEGRVEDILPLADGRFVHPRAIWQAFKGDPAVLQYQLTQQEPHRFALTLVTVDEPAFQNAIARALPTLEALLGPHAAIAAVRRPAIESAANGKFRAVASLCARAGDVRP